MKNIILIFSTIIFIGCQQPVDTDVIGVVKTSDEKTQRILSDLENYNDKSHIFGVPISHTLTLQTLFCHIFFYNKSAKTFFLMQWE